MEYYSCGHAAQCDSDGEYTNGVYALWEVADSFDSEICTAYGVLCNECFPLYGARSCKIGGLEND